MEKICIIGVGYVGLVSAAGLSEFGNEVTCVDLDEEKIKQLNNGEIHIYEPGLKSLVKTNFNNKKLRFTTDINKSIKNSKIIFIAVGTPQKKNGEADLSYVYSVANSIADNLNNYKIISTKSTVPVGTGEEIEKVLSSKSDTKLFDYVSNPELIREGSAVNDFMIPDRLVIGSRSNKAFNLMKNVYRPLFINETPILHSSVETAEMIKYASNAFLALKISYINEIANLCEIVGADVHQVAKAMGQDGRISSKFLHPGPGFGGSCFPKDTVKLSFLGTKNKLPLKTVEAAIEVNNSQSIRMVKK
jgi:nucleotide sugar dehydrogenase